MKILILKNEKMFRDEHKGIKYRDLLISYLV